MRIDVTTDLVIPIIFRQGLNINAHVLSTHDKQFTFRNFAPGPRTELIHILTWDIFVSRREYHCHGRFSPTAASHIMEGSTRLPTPPPLIYLPSVSCDETYYTFAVDPQNYAIPTKKSAEQGKVTVGRQVMLDQMGTKLMGIIQTQPQLLLHRCVYSTAEFQRHTVQGNTGIEAQPLRSKDACSQHYIDGDS